MYDLTISDYLYLFSRCIDLGYTLLFPLLLTGYFLFKRQKQFTSNVLVAANTLLGLDVLLSILYTGSVLFVSWLGQTEKEYFIFKAGPGAEQVLLWFMIGASTLIRLFFLIGRFRTSWILSFFVFIHFNLEKIITWIASFYQDYLPSSWSFKRESYWIEQIILALLYLFLLFSTYQLLKYRKKFINPAVSVIQGGSDHVH